MLNIPSDEQALWQQFAQQSGRLPQQMEQFQQYYQALVKTNEIHNLTSITDLKTVISDHFQDSLALRSFVDCNALTTLGDVGAGAGFLHYRLR